MKNYPFALKIITMAGMTALSGCGGLYTNYDTKSDPQDRAAGLTRKDFIENITPAPRKVEEKVELKEPPLPKITETLSAPQAPKISSNKTVTISVTDDVQLRDVFIELSRLANIDIEVERGITGGVIFKATDMPIGDVLQRITEMAGLRYSVKDGVVRIQNDSPYIETYQASFLNLVRKNSGKIGANTKLQSASGGSSGSGSGSRSSGSNNSGGSNGSEINISSDSSGDIWSTLEKEVNTITKSITTVSPVASRPAGAPGAPGAAAPVAMASAGDNFVSVNKEAGIITVKTNSRGHARIKQYLEQVKYQYSSQVLIEAKVVEVALNDQFRSGIDWNIASKNAAGKGVSANTGLIPNAGFAGFPTPDLGNEGNIFKFDFVRGDISAAVELAQIFGTTRTLSSPRLLAMNNQQAILSFAKNETYFTIECTQSDAVTNNGDVTTPQRLNVTSTLNTVPVGVILTFQSSIDATNNEVTMNIRPTLSRLTGETVTDPATQICIANARANVLAAGGDPDDVPQIDSSIPQIDVREMDSILKLKNNEIMVIGGMIEQINNNTDSGIPWASDIPILGNAFKTVDKNNQAVQTVIFLKATIVPGYGVDGSDQNFYNKFSTDPRPFSF